jgi:cell division septation protein DedD
MRITFLTVIVFSMVLLVGASVWEGVAEVDSAGEVPGNYGVATNSFPRNSVVDIINLENGKMVRVKVVSGLEPSGPLAMLSRVAAESVDLRGNSSARIRMTLPPDDIAYSLFNLGPINPATFRAEADHAELARFAESDARMEFGRADGNTVKADDNAGITNGNTVKADGYNTQVAENFDTATVTGMNETPEFTAANVTAENLLSTITAPILDTPTGTAGYYGEPGIVYGRLSLVPSEERIPTATGYVIAPEDIIPSIGAAIEAQPVSASSEYVPPVDFFPTFTPEYTPEVSAELPAEFSPFQAPLISRLEPNKWYVQVGTFGRAEYVEDEISRIGTDYPLAVQNVGTDTNPLFRILLGPLNQGESGAMLQRFKSLGYADAFVRHN